MAKTLTDPQLDLVLFLFKRRNAAKRQDLIKHAEQCANAEGKTARADLIRKTIASLSPDYMVADFAGTADESWSLTETGRLVASNVVAAIKACK